MKTLRIIRVSDTALGGAQCSSFLTSRKRRTRILLIFLFGILLAIPRPRGFAAGALLGVGDYPTFDQTISSSDEPFVALSAGDGHVVALRADGSVVAWGENEFGQATVPPGLTNVTAIAAGYRHSVALNADGSVVAWGDNRRGATMTPARASAFSHIAAGGETTISLTREGVLQAWGLNPYGRRTLAHGLKDVRSLSAGVGHVVALKLDGKVQVWGSSQNRLILLTSELDDVTAIAAGDWHTLALNRDGSLVTWGGALGDLLEVPADLGTVVSIAAGGQHSVALREDGRVVAWGQNEFGQTRIPPGAEGVASVAAGSRFTMMQLGRTPQILGLPSRLVARPGHRAELTVVAVGEAPFQYQWFKDGELIEGVAGDRYTVDQLNTDDGGTYSLLLSDALGNRVRREMEIVVREPVARDVVRGSLVMWLAGREEGLAVAFDKGDVSAFAAGPNSLLVLTSSGEVFEGWRPRPVRRARVRGTPWPENLEHVLDRAVAVASGDYHRVGLLSSGEVYAWGVNDVGQIDVPMSLDNVTQIAAGSNHTVALRGDGTVVAWGDPSKGQTRVPRDLDEVVSVSAGGNLSLAIRGDGRVIVWGDDRNGDLQPPLDLGAVVSLATGGNHVVALMRNGTVSTWGGISAELSSIPEGLHGVLAVAASENDSYALKVDGTLISWGRSGRQERVAPAGFELVEIGVASSDVFGVMVPMRPEIRAFPDVTARLGHRVRFSVAARGLELRYRWHFEGEEIPGETSAQLEIASVSAADAGRYSVVITDRDGDQVHGQASLHLVDGHPVGLRPEGEFGPAGSIWGWDLRAGESLPIPAGLDDVVAISTRADRSLALRENGQVVVWGGRPVERAITDNLVDVVALSEGANHSLVLKRDGSVFSWGGNTFRQTEIPDGLGRVVGIAAGNGHSAVLLDDGTVRVWGRDSYGQRNVPPDLSDVVRIVAGGNHTLALRADGTVVAWGSNRFGQSDVPDDLTNVVALAADDRHSLALKSDGTLIGWGADGFRERIEKADLRHGIDISIQNGEALVVDASGDVHLVGDRTSPDISLLPAGLRGVSSVALGETHGVAIVLPEAPIIRQGPAHETVRVGHRVRFSVHALGAGPLRYQWFLNGRWVPEASSSALEIPRAQLSDSGIVSVRVFDRHDRVSVGRGQLNVVPKAELPSREAGRWVVWGRLPGEPGGSMGDRAEFLDLDAGRDNLLLINAERMLDSVERIPDGGARLPDGLKDVLSVAAGRYHGLALKGDGTVVAWGRDTYNQTIVPNDLYGVVAIAAGAEHSVALKADGTVVGWGQDWVGRTRFPSSWNDMVAIAAGGEFTLGLRSDGQVLGVGVNRHQQISIPPDLRDVVAIAAGGRHGLALTETGKVFGWGLDSFGQATIPRELDDVIAIDAGENHSVALLSSGELVSWGSNRYGQQEIPPGLGHGLAISAGFGYTAALVRGEEMASSVLESRVVRVELGFPERGILIFLGDAKGDLVLVQEGVGIILETSPTLDPAVWRPIPFEVDPSIGALVVAADDSLPQRFFRIRSN